MMISRRMALRLPLAMAAGTLAATGWARKPAAETAPPLADVVKRITPPVAPPDTPFYSADGKPHHLSDFKGHGLVVNLWATWCAPCVSEMPALAALAKAMASRNVLVLPISVDRGGVKTVSAWYQQHGITGLKVLLDHGEALANAFHVPGVPTTVFINTSGNVTARVEGVADWRAAQTQALIQKLVA